MNKQMRLVGAVGAAVILVGMFILAIELEGNFFVNAGQMALGFFIVLGVGFVLLNLHNTILYFGSTIVFLLCAYFVYKQGWKGTAWGAGGAVLLNVILHFIWVRPNVNNQFNPGDYAREQQKIREEEKARAASGPGALPGGKS